MQLISNFLTLVRFAPGLTPVLAEVPPLDSAFMVTFQSATSNSYSQANRTASARALS